MHCEPYGVNTILQLSGERRADHVEGEVISDLNADPVLRTALEAVLSAMAQTERADDEGRAARGDPPRNDDADRRSVAALVLSAYRARSS